MSTPASRKAFGARTTGTLVVGVVGVVVVVLAYLVVGHLLSWPLASASTSNNSSTTNRARIEQVGRATASAYRRYVVRYYEPRPTTHPLAPARIVGLGRNAPDPFVFVERDRYYLYTSQGNLVNNNVPVQSSTTLGRWGPVTDALPVLPNWVLPGYTWAPDVAKFGSSYVLYFTAAVRGSSPSMECIGAAAGKSPTGPFVAQQAPFICQKSHFGSIDPRTFTTSKGTVYMIWKSDDNADVNGTQLTGIYAQLLSANGLELIGSPKKIFAPDEPWQGRIVEAPDLVQVGNAFWLFYSGNWFNQPYYAIGVARCSGPVGPCHDTSPTPWLASNLQGAGPGEESLFSDANGVWMLYSPFRSTRPSPDPPPRPIAMVRVGFGAGGPYVASTK
ncbi:MAG: glycoside hydrolase family 43 protein [Acidimicrobiales bacterium]